MSQAARPPHLVIACGGTGGHLFPGIAVGERLLERGATVTLVISSKEVDQRAVQGQASFDVLALPAVGFSWGRPARFLRNGWVSYRQAREAFRSRRPAGFLSMGGFTSVPAAMAAHRLGIPMVLHEANAIPGRANRWLARRARQGFVAFPEAAARLPMPAVEWVGMPIRSQFDELDPGACRLALGLQPDRPVLLVTGGSQGATAINEAMMRAAPMVAAALPPLQVLHLTGPNDFERVRQAYAGAGLTSVVRPFLTEMELALGAADAAVTRAGASSIAEVAALRIPAVLIPYPHAAADHQTANALALERAHAARILSQRDATAECLAQTVIALLTDEALRKALRDGMSAWYRPQADIQVAEGLWRLASPSDSASAPDSAERKEIGRAGFQGRGEPADSTPIPALSGGRRPRASPHPPHPVSAAIDEDSPS